MTEGKVRGQTDLRKIREELIDKKIGVGEKSGERLTKEEWLEKEKELLEKKGLLVKTHETTKKETDDRLNPNKNE